MAKKRITCIKHDNDKVITHVGVDGKILTVEQVWDLIENKTHTYYTMEGGVEAKVYHRRHSTTNKKYLTTSSDGLKKNNLDFLPYCPR